MTAPWLMLLATLLFATMGVCVKLASAQYGAGEIVFYRGVIGVVFILALTAWRGGSLRTRLPGMHFWRSFTGVISLSLWFYAIGGLPLATAVTLNYMSSVWMALFMVGGAVMLGAARVDGRLVASVLVGFVGVAMVLQPTVAHDQLWYGLAGLMSGLLAAFAYLQVTALGRAGEPENRIVFYFSLASVGFGALALLVQGGQEHDARGVALLLAIGVLATTAQILMTRAYAIGRTLSNASLQYMGIIFAFIYGVTLFADPVTLMAIGGMTLIVGAGIAATLLRAEGVGVPPPRPTEPT